MKDKQSRCWVINVKLRYSKHTVYRFELGEDFVVDIAVVQDHLETALKTIKEGLTQKGFEILDIIQCEILNPRTFTRDDSELKNAALTASTAARHSKEGWAFSCFVDDEYIAKHPKPWIITTHIKALSSWFGDVPFEEAVYFVDCFVYAVSRECALAQVKDALITRDFAIEKVIRCEVYIENETHHLRKTHDSGGTFDTAFDAAWDFLTTKRLTFGEFIFPEEKAD